MVPVSGPVVPGAAWGHYETAGFSRYLDLPPPQVRWAGELFAASRRSRWWYWAINGRVAYLL